MSELFSIEVFVRKIYSLDTPCYLPSISFRLLDFPTQLIHITDIERIEKIQNKIISKPESISDLARLKNSRGEVIFNKGKSCLFPMKFDNAILQLSNIPLFVVLADVISSQPRFLGSIGISLNGIMMKLQDSVSKSSEICNGSAKGSYPIKNLMGSRVAKINLEVKLYYYGKNLVHHIPALSNVSTPQNSSFTDNQPSEEFLTSMQHITDILHDEKAHKTTNKINDKRSRSDSAAEKHSPESLELDSEEDSDKEQDTTENNNPPPLYYQACSEQIKPISSPMLSNNNTPSSQTSLQRLQNFSKSGSRDASSANHDTNQKSHDLSPPISTEIGGDYDPTRFGLLRAVLTELTYLTDYLDPKLLSNSLETTPDPGTSQPPQTPRQGPKHNPSTPKRTKPTSKTGKSPYGLTHSYVLRLAKLGPDKATEVLARHMGQEAASSLLENYLPPKKCSNVDRSVMRTVAKPVLVSSHCQTEEISPKVAWESKQSEQVPSPVEEVSRSNKQYNRHTPPQPIQSPLNILPGTTPFSINRTEQSTGSMNMAQVIAAMQAIARTSSRLSHSGEVFYSDNFEEPSCTSIRPLSRQRSGSTSPVKSRLSNRASYSTEHRSHDISNPTTYSPNNEIPESIITKPKSSRNMRYMKKNAVIYDCDSSSTTTTTSSTHYSYVRRRKSHSTSKSLSRQSSRSISPIKSGTSFRAKKLSSASSSSPAVSTKGCQTPVPSRSLSIQTNIEESSDNTTTQQTMIKSPVREVTPRVPSEMTDCHSDHSSLRSGSIYIGVSEEESEEEGDPLKLSFLLSTESVQFSDDDQPTSLLKLCSPSEARVANRFMYTF